MNANEDRRTGFVRRNFADKPKLHWSIIMIPCGHRWRFATGFSSWISLKWCGKLNNYPPVIKHGWLENGPFVDVLLKPPFRSGIFQPAQPAMFDETRGYTPSISCHNLVLKTFPINGKWPWPWLPSESRRQSLQVLGSWPSHHGWGSYGDSSEQLMEGVDEVQDMMYVWIVPWQMFWSWFFGGVSETSPQVRCHAGWIWMNPLRIVPVVRFLLCSLYCIAKPIARILDKVSMAMFVDCDLSPGMGCLWFLVAKLYWKLLRKTMQSGELTSDLHTHSWVVYLHLSQDSHRMLLGLQLSCLS